MPETWSDDDELSTGRQQGLVDKLFQWIPGFRGYSSSAARRASDERSRAYIAQRLDQCKQALDRLAQQWVDAGNLGDLAQLDRLRSRIDLLLARLRSGPLAGNRFLDAARLDETQLQDALDHDLQIVRQVDALTELVAKPGSASAADHARHLHETFDRLQASIDRRAELLSDPT